MLGFLAPVVLRMWQQQRTRHVGWLHADRQTDEIVHSD
jgi:hypothetical protein